jgi:NADH-quinone oxidoreductase subunit H
MPEIGSFAEFIRRILIIIFWILLLLPMFLVPIFFLGYAFPVEVRFGFKPAAPINWALIINSLDPNQMNPFNPTSMISRLGLGANSFLFKITTFPGMTFAALFATLTIWYERKLLAKMQYRVGPLYAGRIGGILQPIADLFKLLFKELIIPERADRLFFVAPAFIYMALSGALVAIIPLSSTTFIAVSPYSLLFVFAILGFFPVTTLMAAWASNNKFSFIGGVRALHQMVAYEIPLVLSGLGVAILARSVDLMKVVQSQGMVWFILPQALGAFIFFLASLAELERIPFDLPEADSELVAGWLTEYTGMYFGVLQLAVYIKLYALSAVFTILFLGGWNGPPLVPPVGWFLIKTFIVETVFLIPRGINPRVRIDQLIGLGWARLVALAFVNVFIALAFAAWLGL